MESQKNNSTPKDFPKKIDFIGIFKEAVRLVWENRFLLWFGVLISLGSPAGFNFSPSGNNLENTESAKGFMVDHWQIAVAVSVIIIILGIAIFLISLVAKAGLVKSVNLIALEQKTGFKKGWKEGRKYLLNLFKLFLIFFFAILILILVLATPVVFLLVNHSWIGAFLVGLLAIAILMPILFVMAFTNIFAQFYIILSDLKVFSAIETGYTLLVKNLGNSLVFALLFLVVDIILGIIMLPVIGATFLILFPAGFLFYSLNKIIFGVYLVLAILLAAIVILFFSAIFNTFKTTAWTLFFRDLAKIKEEPEKIAEEEIKKEIAAAPEKA